MLCPPEYFINTRPGQPFLVLCFSCIPYSRDLANHHHRHTNTLYFTSISAKFICRLLDMRINCLLLPGHCTLPPHYTLPFAAPSPPLFPRCTPLSLPPLFTSPSGAEVKPPCLSMREAAPSKVACDVKHADPSRTRG